MTRSEIRAFIRDGVYTLKPSIDYGNGLITDFNSIRSHTYPAAWLLLETTDTDVSLSAPSNKWNILLVIGKIDKMDSNNYEEIVDQCDDIARKLVYIYRNVLEGYKKVTMESVKREKFIKKYADCITGIELSFVINTPDQNTDVC